MPFEITDACTGCQACRKICPVEAIDGKKDKQHVVNKEICIECGACGRICAKGAIIDQFGNVCSMAKRSQWKKPVFDKSLCCSCGICLDICPVSCIGYDTSDRHPYPYVNKETDCIGCSFCATECHTEAVSMIQP